jgi:hypothetical protein
MTHPASANCCLQVGAASEALYLDYVEGLKNQQIPSGDDGSSFRDYPCVREYQRPSSNLTKAASDKRRTSIGVLDRRTD